MRHIVPQIYLHFYIDLKMVCVIMFSEDSGVTSYRGVETIGCVGMQLIVEPDLGLCDDLKPNRFLGTERKRFFKDLAIARSFTFQGWFLMNLLQKFALAWKEIIEYQYLCRSIFKERTRVILKKNVYIFQQIPLLFF